MSSESIQAHHLAKRINRQKELESINGDSVRALEIGRKNFCLKGADLHAARKGKHFVLFKDKE